LPGRTRPGRRREGATPLPGGRNPCAGPGRAAHGRSASGAVLVPAGEPAGLRPLRLGLLHVRGRRIGLPRLRAKGGRSRLVRGRDAFAASPSATLEGRAGRLRCRRFGPVCWRRHSVMEPRAKAIDFIEGFFWHGFWMFKSRKAGRPQPWFNRSVRHLTTNTGKYLVREQASKLPS
jgi:hypothetical protein